MKCCICNKTINGHGNNPWPLCKQPNAKCCDKCNVKVIVERVKQTGLVFHKEESK